MYSSSLMVLVFLYFWGIITFTVILPWLCQDLGFSLYYRTSKHTKKDIEKKNIERTFEAFKFLSHLQAGPQSSLSFNENKEENLRIAFVVVSTNRQTNPHYVIQVVARLLGQIRSNTERLKWRAKIVVLNANAIPSENKDTKFLKEHVTVVSRQTLYKGNNVSVIDNVYEKEKQDYVLALQIGVQLNADYTIIFEDDALPESNFLQKLIFLINWKMPWLSTKPGWGFLKLYYPEKWQGYGNTEIPELIIIFLLGGAVPTIIYLYFFLSNRLRRLQNRFQVIIVILLFVSCGVYCMMVAYSIGRAHLIELGKVSPLFYRVSEAPGCCTPCVLYPRDRLKEIIEFLNSKQCKKEYPLDFALDDFVAVRHLVKYLVKPNLVSHIGYHSSLGGSTKDVKEFSLMFDP